MSEFNYKDYLKNNPLLRNEKESLKEEVKKSSSKITISELKKMVKNAIKEIKKDLNKNKR